MSAETVKVRARDLTEARNLAHALDRDGAERHIVRELASTLDRLHREAAELGEPEGTVAGDD